MGACTVVEVQVPSPNVGPVPRALAEPVPGAMGGLGAASGATGVGAAGRTMRVFAITFSNSYATGGDTLPASIFGLASVDLCLVEDAAGRVYPYDYTNGKLQAFQDTLAAGAMAEVGNATNLSAVTARALVVGKQ